MDHHHHHNPVISVDRTRFASLEANWVGLGPLSLSHSYLAFGRRPDVTEMLLTGTLINFSYRLIVY